MLKKLAIIGLTASALVLVAPVAATAAPASPVSTESYADTPGVKVKDPIINVCQVSTVVFGAGYFLPSETVGVSVSGLNAADAKISGNTAAADGSLVLSFRAPTDGSGRYDIAFAGSRNYVASITVSHGQDAATSCDHDPGVSGGNTELALTDGEIELALTGGSVSPWMLGGGAAALVAGGVLVAAGVTRRKRA